MQFNKLSEHKTQSLQGTEASPASSSKMTAQTQNDTSYMGLYPPAQHSVQEVIDTCPALLLRGYPPLSGRTGQKCLCCAGKIVQATDRNDTERTGGLQSMQSGRNPTGPLPLPDFPLDDCPPQESQYADQVPQYYVFPLPEQEGRV